MSGRPIKRTLRDSRPGQTRLRDGGGHRLASWTRGYATARSEAVCRGAGCGRLWGARVSNDPGLPDVRQAWRAAPCLALSTGRRTPTGK